MAEPLPSLRTRVVLSTAAVSAFVGLLAASGAVAIVRQQQHRSAERRLVEAGQLFSRELEDGEQTVRTQVDDENEELKALGMRLALFQGTRCLGGDPALASITGCVSDGQSRACEVALGARRVVVAGPEVEFPFTWWWLSVALATALSAVVGAVVSRSVGTWALRSLLTLEQHVSSASLTGPLELGERATTAEVESLRAALAALVTRLSEALGRSQVFASSAAHELRTPLSTMSAELELLSAQAPLAEKEAAARVLRTLKRLSLLVDRLLALAQGELGPQRPFETVALEDVVRETVAGRAREEVARISVAVEDEGMIRGDEALLGAIVDNLIDNALKYSAGEVKVQVGASGSSVMLTVSDSGPGISVDQLQALLAPFARGNTGVRGHGLGLSIVSRAVELHGGSLSFEGATVRVTFPGWAPVQVAFSPDL